MTQNYYVTLNEKEYHVSIQKDLKNFCFRICVNKKDEVFADIELLDNATLLMIIGSQVYTVQQEVYQKSSKQNFQIMVHGKCIPVTAITEREKTLTALKKEKKSEVGSKVYSPMPGKVVKILVKQGQEVHLGDGLMIIEAMKMENEIKCQTNGIVTQIHVSEQKSVENQAILIEIDVFKIEPSF